MWKTSIIFPLLAIILADDVPSSGFKCTEKDFLSTSPLPAELALKVNYQATVRYTNWNDSTTALSKEQNFTDVLIIEHVDRNSDKVFVINKDGVVVRDETSCSKTTKESVLPNFYKFDPLITSKILRNGTNLGEIVDSILTANFTTFGPKDTGIVGGIDAVHWIGCLFNATDDGKTGIQVEVYYAGDKSPLPYSKDYKNPVLLGIHLSTFSANSSAKPVTGNITSHYSLDLTELGKTDENQKNKSIELPRGLYCDGMTMLELPGTIPDRFGATVDYVNTQTKQIDTVQMLYDGVLNITSFSMDFENDKDIPFVSGIDVPKNLSRSTIYRDFGYGIQYILSKDSRVCKSVEPLDSRYGDAKVVNNVVELKTAQDILLNVTGVKFYNAGKKNIEGIDVDSFITKKDENDGSYVVIEVNFVQEDWSVENVKGKQLHSIAHFHKDKTGKTTLETFIHFDNFYNYTSLGPLWIKSNVFPCTTDAVDDNFFYINLKNVSLKDVRDYGADNVECALAEAISGATNISVLRISYFMLKEDVKTHDTLACFLVGEKTTIIPTKTAYLKPEKEVKEFSKNINETIGKSGFVIKLLTEKQEAKSIGVDKFGVINTSDEPHPDPSPKFVGYSGGSMFILAIFSFIFGGALALGVYLFYNKRRTIGGMAYQVFE